MKKPLRILLLFAVTALARTLVNDPALNLADEPTGNLHPQASDKVMEVLHQLHEEDRTAVTVTHDAPVAANVERACALEDGALSTDGAGVNG